MLHSRSRSLAIFLLAAALASAQPAKLKPGFNLFSKQQDVELGREASAQVERQMPVLHDAELEAYVNRIGRRLITAPEADAKDFPYSFHVVRDRNINAFALPGGPLYVNTGTILAAENEAQLAGVMAHEISHVALRHGTNQATKSMGVQLVAGTLAQGVGGGGVLHQLTQMGLAFGANSVLLKYSRSAENQADLLGAHIMARAGYNPVEMARFFEKLEAQSGSQGSVAQFLSDHPNPGNRVQSVEREIRYIPQSEYDADTGQLAAAKARVQALGGGSAGPRSSPTSPGRGWRRVQ